MTYYAVLKVGNDGLYAGVERQLHKSISEAEQEIERLKEDADNGDFDFYIDEVET